MATIYRYSLATTPGLVQPLVLVLLSWLLVMSGKPAAAVDTSDCSAASPDLERFVQPLSFPASIELSLHPSGITLGAYKISQKLHPDLPHTTLYAFGTSQETAAVPGPTLLARQNVAAQVRWENHITDEHHFLPQPNATIMECANPLNGGVPVVVHLHGAEVPSMYDGHPDAWITAKNETGPTFQTHDYVYPNEQPATALWYHDHTLGMTRLNVLAGLAGMYIIRETEEEESKVGLPDGVPLVFKDLRFFDNGSVFLPGPRDLTTNGWCAEWFDVWLVNGRAWPFVHVFPRPYRFRLLNICNARFIAFHFNDSHDISFLHIGSDGGFLPSPSQVDSYLVLSPGERADVIIDFSMVTPGAEVILRNFAVEPDEDHYPEFAQPSSKVLLKFIVTLNASEALQDGLIDSNTDYLEKLTAYMLHQNTIWSSHQQLEEVIASNTGVNITVRQVPVVQVFNLTSGKLVEYLLGGDLRWDDPVDIIPEVGSYEIWEVMNVGNMSHNFHVHLINFKVLNEQPLNVSSVKANTCSPNIPYPEAGTCFSDYPTVPYLYNVGWKDTFALFAERLVRILIHFKPRNRDSFGFDATRGPGYVLHCHVVQHEDHSMMRPFMLSSPRNLTSA